MAANAFQMNPRAMVEIQLRADHAAENVREEIAQDAKRMAPVQTGAVKASIGVSGDDVVVGTNHWVYPEYGTENMRAESFMRVALYRKRNLRSLDG